MSPMKHAILVSPILIIFPQKLSCENNNLIMLILYDLYKKL